MKQTGSAPPKLRHAIHAVIERTRSSQAIRGLGSSRVSNQAKPERYDVDHETALPSPMEWDQDVEAFATQRLADAFAG